MNIKTVVGSVLRTSLAAGAGVLVHKGVIDQETAGAAVEVVISFAAGAIAWAVAQGWSLVQKKFSGVLS